MIKKDVFFIFSNLARIASMAINEDDSDWLQYVASTLRCLLTNNESRLNLEEDLQHLPDIRTPNFGAEFAKYCTCQEWLDFVGGKVSANLVEEREGDGQREREGDGQREREREIFTILILLYYDIRIHLYGSI